MKNKVVREEDSLPGISVIVTTFNSESTIDECLRSILELDYPEQLLEVIVVDGGSKDTTIQRIKAYPVKLISCQLNPAEAYNLVLKTVENEIIGLIDSDAKVEKSWLRKLVEHLDDPKIAGASGTVETWNNDKLVPRAIGYELSYRYQRLPEIVGRVATMNLLLKKKAALEVGGFDEALPTQYDTDLGARLVKAGYRIAFDSDAVCYHFHRPTMRAYFKQQFKYGENTWKLYLKHPRLAGGDKITDWWMNIQPIIYVVAAIFLIISVITSFLIPFLILLSLVIITTLQYIVLAARISYIFHDPTAMFLIIIYFTRATAWTIGGATSLIRTTLTRGEGEKS